MLLCERTCCIVWVNVGSSSIRLASPLTKAAFDSVYIHMAGCWADRVGLSACCQPASSFCFLVGMQVQRAALVTGAAELLFSTTSTLDNRRRCFRISTRGTDIEGDKTRTRLERDTALTASIAGHCCDCVPCADRGSAAVRWTAVHVHAASRERRWICAASREAVRTQGEPESHQDPHLSLPREAFFSVS